MIERRIVWLAIVLSAVGVSGLRGADSPATAPAVGDLLNKLGGTFAENNAAMNGLRDGDREVVVPLLIARLKKNVAAGTGMQTRSEHMAVNAGPVTAVWVGIGSENGNLAAILVAHRATSAAGTIRAALDLAMKQDATKQDGTTTRGLALGVYTLSGEVPEYWDWDAKAARALRPSVLEEEKMREIVRPDLVPVRGLTAAFAVSGKGDAGQFISAGEMLTLRLELENHDKEPVPLDLSPANFAFEYTQEGKRLKVAGETMPASHFSIAGKDIPVPAALPPGQKLVIIWQGIAHDLPLTKDLSFEYHWIRVRYAPTWELALKTQSGKEAVLSNSVTRTYSKENP